MKFCRLALVLVFVAASFVTAAAKNKPSTPLLKLDPDYASALNAANHFLQAWQSGDHETGLFLLTDFAKQHTTEELSSAFFSAAQHPAYEIGHGKKFKAGRYSFPVVLYETESGHTVHRRFSHIIMVKAGENDWAVDKLP